MLGTVGGQNRMDGTVISDAVNLAARIESMTKVYGVSLLISERTLERVDGGDHALRMVGRVKAKGKSEVVTVYEVFEGDAPHIIELKQQTLEIFAEGLKAYFAREFAAAERRFGEVLAANEADPVAQRYRACCAHFLENEVEEHWTGVDMLE